MDSNFILQEMSKEELGRMLKGLAPGTILIIDMPQTDHDTGYVYPDKPQEGDENHAL